MLGRGAETEVHRCEPQTAAMAGLEPGGVDRPRAPGRPYGGALGHFDLSGFEEQIAGRTASLDRLSTGMRLGIPAM